MNLEQKAREFLKNNCIDDVDIDLTYIDGTEDVTCLSSVLEEFVQSLHQEVGDLRFYKSNAEENYTTTPISVLRYISELEKAVTNPIEVSKDVIHIKELGSKFISECKSNKDEALLIADFVNYCCNNFKEFTGKKVNQTKIELNQNNNE